MPDDDKYLEPGDRVLGSIGDGPFAGKLIVMASTQRVESLDAEVDAVLEALGYAGSLVTDRSCVGDFPDEEVDLPAVRVALGVPIERDDAIVDVAQRLREKRMEGR